MPSNHIFIRFKKKFFFYIKNIIKFFIIFHKNNLLYAKTYFFLNIYLLRHEYENIAILLEKFQHETIKLDKKDLLLRKKNFKNYSYYELFILYFYSRMFSSFSLQLILRKELIKKISPKSKNYLISRMSIQKFSYKKLNTFNQYEELSVYNKKKRYNYEPKSADNLFLNKIQNKSVAIVGPSNSKVLRGREIDKFDIVIRTNSTSVLNKRTNVFGKKTSVIYFNSNRVRINLPNIKKISKEVEWLVFKSKNDLKKTGLRKKFLRFSKSPQNLMYLSNPMALQIIIYDILRFNPSKVKLFYFDLYSTTKAYNKNYKSFDLSKQEISNSIRAHDMIGCFNFTKQFYDLKLIDIDYKTCKILKSSLSSYAKKLDNLYGKTKYNYGN
jgi:hypothetical protein